MAISGSTIWNNNGAGTDNAGGGFDTSQTAGMFADLAATVATGNAPVLTSASYNFAAGDVGDWVFIGAGTNWTRGWYQIASVASNAATVNAGIGTARTNDYGLNTTAGCATTASPTAGTWSIDRSLRTTTYKNGTTGTISGSNLTPNAYTVGKQDVGNLVQITAGTGVTASWYSINSISGSAWVCDRAPGGSGADITWFMAGAFATAGQMGKAGSATNVGNAGQTFYFTGKQSLTSASNNVAGGTFTAPSQHAVRMEGYFAIPGDGYISALIGAGAITNVTIFTVAAFIQSVKGLIVDGKGNTGVNGFSVSNSQLATFRNCIALNCNQASTNTGFSGGASSQLSQCYAYNCGKGFSAITSPYDCEADKCTTGFALCIEATRCLAHDCSGAGFTISQCEIRDFIAYNNTGDGVSNGVNSGTYSSGVVYLNGGYGLNTAATYDVVNNVASGSNTSGRTHNAPRYDPANAQILLTADPFKNLNGSVTATSGTNLTVDGSNNLKVTPDGYTPQAADVGLKLIILPAASWTPGAYKITAVGGGQWTLDHSPAATSTASGSWRVSDFRPNNTAGGGKLLRSLSLACPTQPDAIDIGAVQHQDPAGGGGLLVHPGMSGGVRG
jgi:hypothetical protein